MRHTFPPLRTFAYLFLLAVVFPLASQAQAPGWQTVAASDRTESGQDGSAVVNASAVDANGDAYVAGSFIGAARIGTFTFGYDSHAPTQQLFVAKWSRADQRFVWAIANVGGIGSGGGPAAATGIVVNGSSVYVTGRFATRLTLGEVALSNEGGYSYFVAKLMDLGTAATAAWGVKMGGDASASAGAPTLTLAVSGQNVYVAGDFRGGARDPAAHFGDLSLTPASPTATNVFVAKLLDEGSSTRFVWVQPAGGTADDRATALAVQDDKVYVAGTFMSSPATFGSAILTPAGPRSLFVSKLLDNGTTGEFIWTRQAAGTATALAVKDDKVYVAGSFSGSADFGGINLTSAGGEDVFVSKLTDMGTTSAFTWAQRVGGVGAESHAALAVNNQNVYLAGSFTDPMDLGTTRLTSTGAKDVFLARLTDAGASSSFAWAQQAGGTDDDEGYAVTVSPTGRVYVGGYISGYASFGTLKVDAVEMLSKRGFVASVQDATGLAVTPASPLAEVRIYPNPAHGTTTVGVPAVPGTTTATLTLLDALGQVVRTHSVALPATGLCQELHVAGLPAGIYLLRVTADNRTTSRRLVVD